MRSCCLKQQGWYGGYRFFLRSEELSCQQLGCFCLFLNGLLNISCASDVKASK